MSNELRDNLAKQLKALGEAEYRVRQAVADLAGEHHCTECGDSFPAGDLAEFEYDYAEDTGFCGIAVCNDCHHDWRIERADARAIDRDIDVRLGK